MFFAQENQNGDVSWCQHWNAENPTESGSEKSFSMISNSKEMEISHFGAEFETDDLTSAKEKRFHTDEYWSAENTDTAQTCFELWQHLY